MTLPFTMLGDRFSFSATNSRVTKSAHQLRLKRMVLHRQVLVANPALVEVIPPEVLQGTALAVEERNPSPNEG